MAERMEHRSDAPMTPLSQLPDYEVADDSPDVRGWNVLASDHRQVGTVDDLLVDTAEMKARYLVVDLNDGASPAAGNGARSGDRILIPAGSTRVNEESHEVQIGISSADVTSLPGFTGSIPERNDRLFGDGSADYGRRDADGEHRITRSAEELSLGRREVPAGEVRVRKHVDTERVREPVSRLREEVRVEHRPASGSARTDIREDEIRVPLTEEEVIVEKRPVAKEEVVITKEQVEDTDTIEEDLRKERIDVERVGRPTESRSTRRR